MSETEDHVKIAREYLAEAQRLHELDIGGHAFFVMGAAIKHTLDAIEEHRHEYHGRVGPQDLTGTASFR